MECCLSEPESGMLAAELAEMIRKVYNVENF
jgi:hypothetical protein